MSLMTFLILPKEISYPLTVENGGTGSQAPLTGDRILVSSAGKIVEAAAMAASKMVGTDANGLPMTLSMASDALLTMSAWTKYTVTAAQLAAASLTNDIELFQLPAKGVIHKVIVKHTTAFAGTLTYNLSVGVSGNLTKFVGLFDVKQVVSGLLFALGGTSVNLSPENFSAATSVRVSAVSTVNFLSQATQGAADVYVLTSQLP